MATGGLRRAFGLHLACELELASLPALLGPPHDPTRVHETTPAALGETWPSSGVERIVQEGEPGSELERFAERHPQAGHLLSAAGFGAAIISPDGRLVTGARTEGRPGRFERLLVGRILPWTALVRGVEVFHAAGVVLDGRAIVLIGQSGAGKTSLAVRLVLAGGRFLTDDVLALDRDGAGAVRAHPGACVAGLRAAERSRLGDSVAALGPLRQLDDKAYATLPAPPDPVPVGAVFFLTRPTDATLDGGPAEVQRLATPPPELLLASTFVLGVRTPERLANLLELCADLAAAVPQYRVTITGDGDSASTAAAILAAL